MIGDESDQFFVRLAIHGRRFELREPGTVRLFLKRTGAGAGFDFDLNGFHCGWRKVRDSVVGGKSGKMRDAVVLRRVILTDDNHTKEFHGDGGCDGGGS